MIDRRIPDDLIHVDAEMPLEKVIQEITVVEFSELVRLLKGHHRFPIKIMGRSFSRLQAQEIVDHFSQ